MRQPKEQFALCLDNVDYKVSLIPGRVYLIVPDERGARDDLVRVVDESGEDYLYHNELFAFVSFPESVEAKLMAMETLRRSA